MTDNLPYLPFRAFLSAHFNGRRVQKLPVDAGFTCPVRDGRLSRSGCAFCNGNSFVPLYCKAGDDIETQLEKGKIFFSRKSPLYGNAAYVAYFQSATNTYADVEILERKYKQALSVPGVEGLVVSTRPDCIDENVVQLLSGLSQQTFVMVELGCESFDDAVLSRAGRHHSVQQIESAVNLLKRHSIPVTAHLIFGLPGESSDSVLNAAQMANRLGFSAVKLHQLQIVRGSRFFKEYEANPNAFRLYSVERYVADVCTFLENLSTYVAVDRFVSEMPPSDLIAPRWGLKPDAVVAMVKAEMLRRKSVQGANLPNDGGELS